MGFIFIGESIDPRLDCPADRVYLLDPDQVATSDDNGETWQYPFAETQEDDAE